MKKKRRSIDGIGSYSETNIGNKEIWRIEPLKTRVHSREMC